jgi:hypothetical protein
MNKKNNNTEIKNENKNTTTYTKNMLIREICGSCHRDRNTVSIVYNALERNLMKLLSSASNETDVSVRLFEGISINSSYIEAKEKINNLTGDNIITKSKIKPKVNITRRYIDKLSSYDK